MSWVSSIVDGLRSRFLGRLLGTSPPPNVPSSSSRKALSLGQGIITVAPPKLTQQTTQLYSVLAGSQTPPYRPFTTADAAPPGFVNRPVFSDWSTSVAIQDGMKASHWVYACVWKLMESAGSIPWKVQQFNSTLSGKTKWEDDPGHDLELLMAEPNENMTGTDLIARLTSHLFLGGNGMITKTLGSVGGRQKPIELWPQFPDTLRPVPGAVNLIERYEFRAFGEVVLLPPDEVIHMMFIDPGNVYWGMSPMQAGSRVVDIEVDAVNWWKTSLQNRCIPDGMISFTDALGDTSYKRARAKIDDQKIGGAGQNNARGIFIASGGAKFERFSLTPAEMDFIESRKVTRQDICAIFGVPLPMVGIYDDATLANIKTARKIFWLDTMVPYLSHLQDAFNLGLAGYWGKIKGTRRNLVRVVYDLSQVEALQEDYGEKVTAGKVLFTMGVPVNQINAKLELGIEEYEGWDVGWIPSTLLPIGDAINPMPAPTPAPAPALNPSPNVPVPKPAAGVPPSNGKPANGKPAKALDPVSESNWLDHLAGMATAHELPSAKLYAEPKGLGGGWNGRAHGGGQKALGDGTLGEGWDSDTSDALDAWDWDDDETGQKAERDILDQKVLGINTEPRKLGFWRSYDRNRQGFERQLSSRMGLYFSHVGGEIASAVRRGEGSDSVSPIIKSASPDLSRILMLSWRDTIGHFGAAVATMLGGRAGQKAEVGGRRGRSIERKADEEFVWDPWSEEVQQAVSDFVGNKITKINRTTRDRIRNVISDGFSEGHSIDEVAKNIQDAAGGMSKRRSMVIARTEIVGASNYASHSVAKSSGLLATRTWVSSRDDRVRDTHRAVDGTELKGFDGMYPNGCRFPGDPSGPAKEVVNCRCSEVYQSH